MKTEDVWIGWLITVLFLAALAFIILWRVGMVYDRLEDPATMGGTTVPAVHCQEDEVISWLGPDRLGCVHFMSEVK